MPQPALHSATSDCRAASRIGSNGPAGSVTVVGIVRPPRSRRTRDPVRRQSSVGDVIVPWYPVKRPPVGFRADAVDVSVVENGEVIGGPVEGLGGEAEGWGTVGLGSGEGGGEEEEEEGGEEEGEWRWKSHGVSVGVWVRESDGS